MRVSLDPFPDRKSAAVVAVNEYFAGVNANAATQEAAWTRKRALAETAKAVGDGSALAQEASLRGLTVQEFTDLILSKPDPATLADARELQRQTALLAIDAANTPAELDAILEGLLNG